MRLPQHELRVNDGRRYLLPAGTASAGAYELEVTPESAGWGYSGLRVVALAAAEEHRFDTGVDEVVVVPLSGGLTVEADGSHVELDGRRDVFAGPTDFAYLPPGTAATLHSERGGRFALCSARTERRLPVRRVAAADVAVELRGAGRSSRQVRNFGTPDHLDAGAIIACEVITPDGNWSSYPAHKHDEAGEHESELEEIYYFEIAAGPQGQPGLGFFRTSSSPGHAIEITEEVHDRDVVLVPFGWHGPAVAAPGHAMYYLNVMAGPPHPGSSGGRAWLISDHPDQTWVRATWADQEVDPRLTKETP
ncbi:5-deoxy-glucuronate isomerase [Microlunatus flavus]|uniref:5-deoxy-glucuronate isomerase n=1 Tax=Microlunatus flavus TaxID=1036181 RepID=A0A1H9CGI9_9ACTN|nr:5-deoxy-glucuronate isomerase [Microlunatus flavus]SEQ00264.1 5-deoxy-glucuronate isomerase [Microlunatus flavus]